MRCLFSAALLLTFMMLSFSLSAGECRYYIKNDSYRTLTLRSKIDQSKRYKISYGEKVALKFESDETVCPPITSKIMLGKFRGNPYPASYLKSRNSFMAQTSRAFLSDEYITLADEDCTVSYGLNLNQKIWTGAAVALGAGIYLETHPEIKDILWAIYYVSTHGLYIP